MKNNTNKRNNDKRESNFANKVNEKDLNKV